MHHHVKRAVAYFLLAGVIVWAQHRSGLANILQLFTRTVIAAEHLEKTRKASLFVWHLCVLWCLSKIE